MGSISPYDRFSSIVRSLEKAECSVTRDEFLSLAKDIYGTKKVQQVCSRYHIFVPHESAKPLKLDMVKQLQVGLCDVTVKDLDKLLKKLRQEEPISLLEEAALRGIDKEELKKYKSTSKLQAPLFNALLQAMREPAGVKFSSSLSPEKITGIPGKYIEHGWISHQSGRSLEDEERLTIYKELEALGPKDQTRYCELLSKIVVKKHLFYEKAGSNELQLGTLVPGLKGRDGEARWYKVGEILDTGWGKFAYRLVPATEEYPDDMPDLLLYRSSATLPTAMDAFTSYLSDINVLPPGYVSRDQSKEQELRWLTDPTPAPGDKKRPLLMTGHSLGASNCQLALMNLSKAKAGESHCLERNISLELFDSPAVIAEDALAFADWYDTQHGTAQLTFNYYVSKGDVVPLSGALTDSTYLGNYITKDGPKLTVHELELTERGFKKEGLTGLGPHGRIFFRGTKGADFQDHQLTIAEFDKKNRFKRIAVNIARAIGAVFVWGLLGVGGGLKRFFFGRRHHDPVMLQLFRKAIEPLHPKEVKKETDIDKEIKNISNTKECIELELMGMTRETSGPLKQKIDEAREAVKKLSKALKILDPERGQVVEKIGMDLEKLQGQYEEKGALLSARERFRGAPLPHFEQQLSAIQTAHPDLAPGCQHLLKVVSCQMRLEPHDSLSTDDITQLKAFRRRLNGREPEVVKLVDSQIKILKTSFKRKEKLLEELSRDFPHPDRLTTGDKIRFFVRLEQILHNPFEPALDSTSVFQSCKTLNKDFVAVMTALLAKPAKKGGDFWDQLPPLERMAHQLATTPPLKKWLHECKIEGLKAIAQGIGNEAATPPALIIGAGPAGLMHAIALTLSGKPFQIVELRPEDKKARDNIIVLGKDDPKDLRILLFLGIIADWESNDAISIERFQAPTLEVRIQDVEDSLKATLVQMHGGASHILYEKKITSIENEGGKAKVVVQNKDASGSKLELYPSQIFVTDGFSGSTRKMLGISREVLAKTTQIIYAVFQKPERQYSPFEIFTYVITYGVKALGLIVQVIASAIFKSKTIEQAYGAVSPGGPSALFRIPKEDYTGRAPREEEQAFINSMRDEIRKLDKKIAMRPSAEAQSLLKKQRAGWQKKLDLYLEERAKDTHGQLDVLHALFGRKHHVQPMKIDKNVPVDVIMSKAERSFMKVGKTPIFLRGDASHSTDPYSGYGCKTALEETLADQFSTLADSPEEMSDLELACEQWGHHHYQEGMINRGLISRDIYASRTELVARYTALGVHDALITEEEGHFLQQIAFKAEKLLHNPMIKITKKELGKAKVLQLKLADALKKAVLDRKGDLKDLQSCLHSSEMALVKKTITLFLNEKKISAKDADRMEPIVAKLACRGIKEASILALLLKNPRSVKVIF